MSISSLPTTDAAPAAPATGGGVGSPGQPPSAKAPGEAGGPATMPTRVPELSVGALLTTLESNVDALQSLLSGTSLSGGPLTGESLTRESLAGGSLAAGSLDRQSRVTPVVVDRLMMQRMTRFAQRVEATRVRMLGLAEAAGVPERQGFTDAGSWLSSTTHTDRRAAAVDAQLANDLADADALAGQRAQTDQSAHGSEPGSPGVLGGLDGSSEPSGSGVADGQTPSSVPDHGTSGAATPGLLGQTSPSAATRSAISQALDAGTISTQHAKVMLRALRELPATVTDDQRRHCEAELLRLATRVTPARLRRAAERLLAATGAAAAVVDAHQNDAAAAREERAWQASAFWLRDNSDGTMTGQFTVPWLAGAALKKIVDAMTAPRRTGSPGARGASGGGTGDGANGALSAGTGSLGCSTGGASSAGASTIECATGGAFSTGASTIESATAGAFSTGTGNTTGITHETFSTGTGNSACATHETLNAGTASTSCTTGGSGGSGGREASIAVPHGSTAADGMVASQHPGSAPTRPGAQVSAGHGSSRDARPFSWQHDQLDWQQRRGQAFAELLLHLPTDHLHNKTAATLLVTTTLQALRGELAQVGRTDLNENVSAGDIRRLACGAGIVPTVLGSDSVPLDLGRQSRCFTGHQRTALATRYTECAADGCDRPFAWSEVHHLRPWQHGGSTNLANAVPLCGTHHRWIDRGDTQHQVRRRSDGTVTIHFHRRT